jgi:hypothetical protein
MSAIAHKPNEEGAGMSADAARTSARATQER